MPKRVTSGVAHLRDLAPGRHGNVAEVASRWRHVCADLTGRGIKPQTSRTNSVWSGPD